MARATTCPSCGSTLDALFRFCPHCGVPLAQAGEMPPPRPAPVQNTPFGMSPETAANFWDKFFRPFFKTAFIFFGLFFSFAFIMMIVWYFLFRR